MQYLNVISLQILVIGTFFCIALCEPTVQELKCQVCKALVKESVEAIAKVDPKKKIPVGSFRLQADGTQKQKSIPYAGSEAHMHDVLDEVCNQMDNYAQATHKENGELILVNLSKDVEKLSTYQVVADPTANGKIKQLCEDMIGEYEDDYVRVFSKHKIRVEPQAFRLLCENNKEICGEKVKEEL
ncbi:protein canopy homolog 2 [Dermacentor andersoni]|uniref:protein canopy homolog 2 n=1 Tax=Dermacentor andersoni TaxID=34620 RepID=UPI002155125F|nr:protein canopy homolog 2-like [Dermacentor andersoni]